MRKTLLHLSLIGLLATLSLCPQALTQSSTDCPSSDCLERECRLAQTAQRLEIPLENWAEFGRQMNNGEFCGQMSCCCQE